MSTFDPNTIHQGSWIDEKRIVALIVDTDEIDYYLKEIFPNKTLTKEEIQEIYETVSEKITDYVMNSIDYDLTIKSIIKDYHGEENEESQ